MEEIKVGEYVRTDRGIIYKYTEIEKNDLQARDFRLCNDGEIIKHSPNIIDLIEVGDYVNGESVEEVSIGPDEFEITTTTEYLTNVDDIKSIVTKEQFEDIEYRLEEKNDSRDDKEF